MTALTDVAETRVLQHLVNELAWTAPTTLYLALYTADPGEGGAGTEVSGGSYARQPITFNTVAGSTVTNNGDITFPTATADWGIITHGAIIDAATAGFVYLHSAFSPNQTINNGGQFKVLDATLTISLD